MGELDCGAPIIVDQLRLIELHGPAAAAVDDRPISLRLLHEDPASGEEHYLVRYPTIPHRWSPPIASCLSRGRSRPASPKALTIVAVAPHRC